MPPELRRAPRHSALLRFWRRHPLLKLAIATAIVVYLLLPETWRAVTRLLVAWGTFSLAYLGLVGWMMAHASLTEMRRRAADHDFGDAAILMLSILAAVAGLAAAVSELAFVKPRASALSWETLLTGATVALSWFFVHVMFALHYAHTFYSDRTARNGPDLRFPDELSEPHYGEFLYFSFVIGCACATADVDIRSPMMRRVAMAHGVIAFFL